MGFILKLVDINSEIVEQFELQFSEFPEVEVYSGYFEDIENYDCLVSPANSFGIMDGGIDAAIIDYFGKQLEERVQIHIIENFCGEQPIGTSFIVPTYHRKHPYLAHTPTMQIPQNIQGTNNVYYAMKAMLMEVENFNKINTNGIYSVLCPGLGTFIGKMKPYEAVRQMALAYEHFKNPPKEITHAYASHRSKEINTI